MNEVCAMQAAAKLSILAPDANKYSRGTCELLVGSPAYAGAGVLAAQAASRVGAGYVRAYTSAEAAAALRVVQPSAVCKAMADFSADSHQSRSGHPLAAVVGCGFEGHSRESALVMDALRNAQAPLLVDGGGLSALCSIEAFAALTWRFEQGLPTVITPHGGEAARLARFLVDAGKASSSLLVLDAPELAARLAQGFASVCVLKGPDTYIATPDACDGVSVVTAGTPALAKAGTGDVLAGALGGLMSQGIAPKSSCELGVYLHARAGVLAAQACGELCVTTEDVLANLAAAIGELSALRGAACEPPVA